MVNNFSKILVVDDDNLVTSSLKSLFMIEGIDGAVFFNNPNEALDFLKENKCEVIISDFMMPQMNGLEFLSEAKKLYPASSMILLTGYADKENAIKAINEVGLYKYIEKPWDNDELIINIKNASERSNLIEKLEESNEQLKKYSLHLEELVREKTQHLSAVINNCADGILLVSSSGNILEANPQCETLFGLSSDIIKSKNFFDLFNFEDENFKNILNSSNPKIFRNINILNAVNGIMTPVEISEALIDSGTNSDITKYVLVIRDVHFQKEMDRLREDFIATLTHDLRTPSLASIQTLEYFINGKLGELNDKQLMLLKTMKKSNEDMLGLVNTLLEVYKYESGRLNLVKTPFDFKELLDECIEQVTPIAQAKHQNIEKNYVNLESQIVADRNEIRRVIINLLGNAIKYTQDAGLIEVNAQIDGNDVRFSVKDNGEGIYKKDIPKLFKRFSQGTQEKRSISTGLGLYLSKQIIDAHGGKIWLESDKGKGSEFFFLLLDAVKDKDKEELWTA